MKRIAAVLLALGACFMGCDGGSGSPATGAALDLSGRWQLSVVKTYATRGKVPETNNHAIDIVQNGTLFSFTLANSTVAVNGNIDGTALAFQWTRPCAGTCSEQYYGTVDPAATFMSGTWSGFDEDDTVGGTWSAVRRK